MSVGIESLFTNALGLRDPWFVEDVRLDTAAGRIDFEVACKAKRLPCPSYGSVHEPVHNLADAQLELGINRRFHNEKRPHSSLGTPTPSRYGETHGKNKKRGETLLLRLILKTGAGHT